MSTVGEVGAVPEDDDRPSVPPPSGPPPVTRSPGASTVVTPTGWPAPPSPDGAPVGRPQPVGYPPVAPMTAPTQAQAPAPPEAPAATQPLSPGAAPVGVPPRPAPLPPPRDLVPAPPIPAPAASRPAYSMPSEPFTAPRPARLAPEPVARRLAGRRSRLTVRRLDPWSVFVMSLLLTLFLAVMTVIAALVLYFVLDSVGAIDSINRGVDD
ncbi:MAG: hypothetical protein JWN31_880, partial [Frankiales bacterium]|nr:hypothetical protein [Frankiales bacterium]